MPGFKACFGIMSDKDHKELGASGSSDGEASKLSEEAPGPGDRGADDEKKKESSAETTQVDIIIISTSSGGAVGGEIGNDGTSLQVSTEAAGKGRCGGSADGSHLNGGSLPPHDEWGRGSTGGCDVVPPLPPGSGRGAGGWGRTPAGGRGRGSNVIRGATAGGRGGGGGGGGGGYDGGRSFGGRGGYGVDIGSGNWAAGGNDIRIRNVLGRISQGMQIGSHNVTDADNVVLVDLSAMPNSQTTNREQHP